ncbi:MAG: phosphoribosyltransferase domain-containing protein [Halothiobacillaceae bacterium]
MNWQTIELPSGTLEVREAPANTHALASLCCFGARNNLKRGFLFVSTVLGKHLPAKPSQMLDIHQHLAAKIHAIDQAPVVFIGMAETGVSLSYGVYEAWANKHPEQHALFIHSTRYPLNDVPALNFEEGHSHAPSQVLHLPADPAMRATLRRAQTLVLLDDEVSTGKTFLNLWHALSPHCPSIKHINIVTLTDFMGQTATTAFNQALSLPTTHISAARAEWRFSPKTWQAPPATDTPAPYRDDQLKPLAHLGRCGIERPLTLPPGLLHEIATLLAQYPDTTPIRIIGTGEFMHIPYLLALQLEQQGRSVTLQSSTRSPILEFGPIQHTQGLDDPYGQGDAYFIYNAAPDANSLTFILHETAPNPAIRRMAEQLGAHPISCAHHWPSVCPP